MCKEIGRETLSGKEYRLMRVERVGVRLVVLEMLEHDVTGGDCWVQVDLLSIQGPEDRYLDAKGMMMLILLKRIDEREALLAQIAVLASTVEHQCEYDLFSSHELDSDPK